MALFSSSQASDLWLDRLGRQSATDFPVFVLLTVLPKYVNWISKSAAIQFSLWPNSHSQVTLRSHTHFRNPETAQWSAIPWDIDLTWGDHMYGGGNEPFQSPVLSRPAFRWDYHPIMISRHVMLEKAGQGLFYQGTRSGDFNLKRAVEGLEFSQLIPFAICCTNPCCNQEGEPRSSWIPYQFRHLQKGMTLNCFF